MISRKWIKYVLVVLAISLLAFFVSQVDLKAVVESLGKVGWKFLYILLVTYTAYFMATVAWALCIDRNTRDIPMFKLFNYRLVGETLALINPTNIIAGEASKIYMLEQLDIDKEMGLVSIMLSRILIIMSSLILLILAVAFYFKEFFAFSDHFYLQIGLMVLFLSLVVGLFYILISPRYYLYDLYNRLCRLIPIRVLLSKRSNILGLNQELSTYYQHNKLKLIGALFLSTGHWLMGALEFYVILYILGFPISLIAALMIEMGVIMVKSAASFIPAQVGVEEYGNKLMLDFVGLKLPGLWLTVSVLRRARQLFWILLGVIMSIFILKRSS